HGRMRADA
ncbi:unnamed protein product, partial [Fusarium langsethiae]